jgi:hypothetical protein
MTGPLTAVDSSSGKSRNSRCSCFAPAPGGTVPQGRQRCRDRRGQRDEPALTLVEDLDYATECLLPNTVTSLAAGIEWIFLIFMAGHHLT